MVCRGKGRFPFTKFLSVSIPCFIQSPTKPGTAAPHSVLADDMALQPSPGTQHSLFGNPAYPMVLVVPVGLGTWIQPLKPDLHQEGCRQGCPIPCSPDMNAVTCFGDSLPWQWL